MKKSIAILMALALLLSVTACSGQQAPAPQPPSGDESSQTPSDPIRIGVITSITGERALVGEYCKNAINMAVNDLNSAGGVLGRQVEVVYEDDLGTDTGAVNALNKLATDDKIAAIVGPYYGTMILALDGEIRKSEIPVLTATSLEKLADFNNPWLFQARTHDGYVPPALINHALSTYGQKISIIYGTDASGIGQYDSAVKALEEHGLKPVSADAYNTGDKDFTAQIIKVQQADPDAIVCFGLQVEAGLIMKQLRDMGVNKPILGLASYASKIAIDLAGEAANNVYCLTDYVPNTPRPEGQTFAKKYLELYKIESDFTAAVDFDKFQLIIEAIKIADSAERDAIREAMYKIQGYHGVSNVFAFDDKGVGGTSILLIEVKDQAVNALTTIDVK